MAQEERGGGRGRGTVQLWRCGLGLAGQRAEQGRERAPGPGERDVISLLCLPRPPLPQPPLKLLSFPLLLPPFCPNPAWLHSALPFWLRAAVLPPAHLPPP